MPYNFVADGFHTRKPL